MDGRVTFPCQQPSRLTFSVSIHNSSVLLLLLLLPLPSHPLPRAPGQRSLSSFPLHNVHHRSSLSPCDRLHPRVNVHSNVMSCRPHQTSHIHSFHHSLRRQKETQFIDKENPQTHSLLSFTLHHHSSPHLTLTPLSQHKIVQRASNFSLFPRSWIV